MCLLVRLFSILLRFVAGYDNPACLPAADRPCLLIAGPTALPCTVGHGDPILHDYAAVVQLRLVQLRVTSYDFFGFRFLEI